MYNPTILRPAEMICEECLYRPVDRECVKVYRA